MDKGLYTGVVLIDLQKAFDTVDHRILLSKLGAIGFSNDEVNWFRSYLSSRSQVVDINNHMSSKLDITCGVPQGSILGPLLFLIYVNDMESAVNCNLFLYADDSALVTSGKNSKEIESSLNKELLSLSKWLEMNKLSLHLGKTESIVFASKYHLKKLSKININCKDVEIESKDKIKYLGAYIEQDLSGNCMGTKVVKKSNCWC
jgi:3-polyprenyl-4-hydroxybenzoate decarboxylase